MKADKFSKNCSFSARMFLFEMNGSDPEGRSPDAKKVDYKVFIRHYSGGASAKVFLEAGVPLSRGRPATGVNRSS